MLHGSHGHNVKAFGAVGDGLSDDTVAINSAIASAYAAGTSVFFPVPSNFYKITSTIDLSGKTGLRLVGGEASGVGEQGGSAPQARLGSAGADTMFKYDGTGADASIVFENLTFFFPSIAVRMSDAANVWFRHCVFSAGDTATAHNSCVLLENWFWAWFEDCAFTAPTTSKPAVKLRGKEPSPNADHNYLIHFKDCRFWKNGVLYEDANEIAVNPAHAERISFEGCDTENFATTSALMEFTKTAGTNWGGRYVKQFSMRNCAFYDFTGTPTAVRFSIPNGINTAFFENVLAPRLIERSSGSGGVFRAAVSGFEGTPFVNGSGADLGGNIFHFGALSSLLADKLAIGDTITAQGSLVANKVSANKDQFTIPDTTVGAGLTIGGDTNLYRAGANYLGTDDAFSVTRAFVDQDGVGVLVSGDNNYRIAMRSGGKLDFGPGNAATDTNLYRSAADTLKTDDTFLANVAGLGTKHEGAATPTGGTSGEIRIGTGKIWVNDAGTWKSVAVA